MRVRLTIRFEDRTFAGISRKFEYKAIGIIMSNQNAYIPNERWLKGY